MDSRITELYDDYIHGSMPRREFLRRVTELAGSAVAASSLVALLEPNWAWGRQVEPDDERLATGTISYPGTTGDVNGYLARPRDAEGPLPGVLVIHENRGLNAHIEDVARRAALAGYVALAPDGLTYVGGGLVDQEAARDRFSEADRDVITDDVLAGIPWLADHEATTGKVGTVGFCYGGGVALLGAARSEAVAGAVCFYGRALSAEDTAKVSVPLLLHYAADDERINAGIPAFKAALEENDVAYTVHMYDGVGHGFHNDTSQARYHGPSAALAWNRTLRFFGETLA